MAKVRRLAAVSVLIVLLGSASFGVCAQSPDDAAIAKQFLGMWRLVARTNRFADGTTRLSVQNVAYIFYTDTNPMRMCYVGMDPNRPKWKSGFVPTESEALSGINGSSSYCSTVEVHAKEGLVVHHVEISSVPNLVGRDRKRWFTFDGPNRLTLRVDAAELRPEFVGEALVWERVR
jgi:hypothetical protein